MAELNQIKTRIKTVGGVKKVTSAMKLVSTVKLQKWKNKMLANREYSLTLQEITDLVFSDEKIKNTIYSQVNLEAKKNLYIIVSSTLGLCGSYNYNIFDLANSKIKKEDDAIILGKKAISFFKNNEFRKIEGFDLYNSINDEKLIRNLTNYILDEYNRGTYREIHIIYTMYKNSLTFLPKDEIILPLGEVSVNERDRPIFEPSINELANNLVPMFVKTNLFARLLESEVSEHASRSNAMNLATDNANDILDKLKIEFNKARQAAITNEITEIVSGANVI
jgi:F-type H+-transporting ATPase subunit gamma